MIKTDEKVFAINPGETELEGLLRTAKLMIRQLDWNTPQITDSLDKAFFTYGLIRHYIKMYDSIPQKQLMIYLLKYPTVSELYNRVKEISERPHYKLSLALIDAAWFAGANRD